METQKQQVAERLKQANNILVTVSNNPSVDQLAACIGLTLTLNKMGKHATAVFSGNVPSTLEFLQPEKTLEKNTDSLRDFIISLDKAKADKLRYKVEDKVVKIFITPYRTSISDKDLEFSQGDFNVDVVLALGVHNQTDLDQAITSHGRILHDATIATLNTKPGGELGSINWLDPATSSLSELSALLVDALDKQIIDGQIATAFLTGIVAETDRFSNSKTTPQTMSVSAELMGHGANQQLVALKLEEPAPAPATPISKQSETDQVAKKSNDGTLEIKHMEASQPLQKIPTEPTEPAPAFVPSPQPPALELPPVVPEAGNEPALGNFIPEPPQPPAPQIKIDEQGDLLSNEEKALEDLLPPVKKEPPAISHHSEPPKMVLQPPALGAPLNAASTAEVSGEEGAGLPGMPLSDSPQLANGAAAPQRGDQPASPANMAPVFPEEGDNAPGTTFLGDQPVVAKEEPKIVSPSAESPLPPAQVGGTLADIERSVHSKHLEDGAQSSIVEPALAAMPPAEANSVPPVSSVAPAPVAQAQIGEEQSSTDSPADSSLDSARNAVMEAINGSAAPAPAVQALNAQPWTPESVSQTPAPAMPVLPEPAPTSVTPGNDPNSPPPVPPPMMPQLPQ